MNAKLAQYIANFISRKARTAKGECLRNCSSFTNYAITYAQAGRELNHFLGLDVLETVNTGNTVTNGEHAAGLLQLGLGGGLEDALLEDR
jgi:hypothetical protein